ncbi:MarR family winged helix-turn-helix transcriptional regulator [Rhizobium sp. SL42]|uniref:MarR family winged helix-turn-helix transcriptional regulator n=1 Tax=Rhizobium sp. SL42 TaxID=2806346 RepID=UPI001F00FB94|nr:MarR family transcriptional regulator [Rhizobium sp. SL42]UJW76402.1 MarR family transcriptional regulator [Rhizobium sp. SL42]
MATVSDLTAHTGYWMRMVSNAVSQEFSRKVAGEGVTVAEWAFMRALYDQDDTGQFHMAPSALADRMGMTKGAISKLADRLQEKRLVGRAENERDGRAHRLFLTVDGRAKVPVLAALADATDADYFGVLTPEEHALLSQTLRTLAERRGIRTIPVD